MFRQLYRADFTCSTVLTYVRKTKFLSRFSFFLITVLSNA